MAEIQPPNKQFENNTDFHLVSANSGKKWLIDAFQLFKLNPGTWLSITFLLAIVLSILPFLQILMPTLIAGLMVGCQRLSNNQDFKFSHLFTGFQRQLNPLILTGLIYIAGALICYFIAELIVSNLGYPLIVITPEMLAGDKIDLQTLQSYSLSVLLVTLFMMLLMTPVFMAFWFTPALIIFRQVKVVDALKSSFLACQANLKAFMVYGLVGMFAIFAFSIGLLIVWRFVPYLALILLILGSLIFVAIFYASMFTSFKDIYKERIKDISQSENTPDNDEDGPSSIFI